MNARPPKAAEPLAELPEAEEGRREARLLERYAASGDTAALNELFVRNLDRAYRVALRFSANTSDAEDAVQAGFVDLMHRAKEYRGEGSVRAYIMGFVIAACRAKTREQARRSAREEKVAAIPREAPPDAGSEAEKRERLRHMMAALEILPEHYRLPVWLHYAEGLTSFEIARALDLSDNTIRSQIRRGLEELHGRLASLGFADAPVPALLASAPLAAAPAALLAAVGGLAKSGAATAVGVAVAKTGATAAKPALALQLGGTAMKVAAVALLATAAATAAVTFSSKKGGSAEPAPPAQADPQEKTPAEADTPKGNTIKGNPQAPLGAPDYVPSSEHAGGWRGDGTGCFVGAPPPLTWGRWAKGSTHEIRCQAGKPKGADASGAAALEFGNLKEWLVAGPFGAEGLPNESDLSPDLGEKAGVAAWKHFRANMESQSSHLVNGGICATANVDFEAAFGAQEDKCAYAHTHLFSPEAGKAILFLRSSNPKADKAWFNGKAVDTSKSLPLDVAKGWNRLLVKVPSGGTMKLETKQTAWLFSAYLRPTTPIEYASKNVAWVTPLPRWSASTPVVVGDRVYVQCGTNVGCLACINKADGKLLWIRPYAWPALLGQNHALGALCDEFVKLANASVSENGPGSSAVAALDLKANELLKQIEKANKDSGKPKIDYQDGGANNSTACTDGKRIVTMFGCNEKMVVCFDLDGKQLWMYEEPVKAWEHGNHGSPVMSSGRVFAGAGDTAFALDAETGKEVWKVKDAYWRMDAASPVALNIGGNAVVLMGHKLLRASDGKVLSAMPLHSALFARHVTPSFANGIGYMSWTSLGDDSKIQISAVNVSAKSADDASLALAWQQAMPDPMNTAASPWNRPGFIASGLLHDGLYYSLDMMGTLYVADTAAQKVLYAKVLDKNAACDRFAWGICTSPALAGKNIYLMDNEGGTTVLAPGKEYKELAYNTIEQYGHNGDFQQKKVFTTSPVFDGKRAYLFCWDALFCIEEK